MQTYSCMVGGMNHLALPLHLRLSLDGFLLEEPVHPPHLTSPYCCLSPHHCCFHWCILRRFWGIKENPRDDYNLSHEECSYMRHFCETHNHTSSGRFVISLQESTSNTLWSIQIPSRLEIPLTGSLPAFKGSIPRGFCCDGGIFRDVMWRTCPGSWLKPPEEVFYLPMQAVRKEHSTTTKMWAMFDASAKSSTGVSLNDTLLLGPTAHPPLIDVLLRFRLHCDALTTYISKMYQAIKFVPPDHSLHRFMWRGSPDEPFLDCRMTKVTFGISASSFATNMAVPLAEKKPPLAKRSCSCLCSLIASWTESAPVRPSSM